MVGAMTARSYRWALAAILLLGLTLRVAAAQGALWLDEAWSAVLAHEAGTPLGVFVQINHDNNHHLNSLWLQLVGLGAPPLLARTPAILAGTATIYVAALLGARRGQTAGLVTALLFAISPMLVTLGSEARGYAPMALALLVALRLADKWLAGESERSPATALALCFLLGALSQLTMIFGFCALAGWVFFALWQRFGPRQAVLRSLALLWPSLLALAAVIAIVAAAAASSRTGFQFGRYDPFAWLDYLHALVLAAGSTLGWPVVSLWWLVLVPALVLLAPGMGVTRIGLHRLAILAFPLTLALLHAGNTGYPRYYLVAGLALLLLVGEMLAIGFGNPRWRWAAAAALAAILSLATVEDLRIIAAQRGDPGGAIRAMATRSPGGTSVILDRATGKAILQVAAAEQHYPLAILENRCGRAPYLFLDRPDGEAFPAASLRCGRRYRPIARAQSHGLSGSHWTLYALQP
jgi:uncharacterized membrane protein